MLKKISTSNEIGPEVRARLLAIPTATAQALGHLNSATLIAALLTQAIADALEEPARPFEPEENGDACQR